MISVGAFYAAADSDGTLAKFLVKHRRCLGGRQGSAVTVFVLHPTSQGNAINITALPSRGIVVQMIMARGR